MKIKYAYDIFFGANTKLGTVVLEEDLSIRPQEIDCTDETFAKVTKIAETRVREEWRKDEGGEDVLPIVDCEPHEVNLSWSQVEQCVEWPSEADFQKAFSGIWFIRGGGIHGAWKRRSWSALRDFALNLPKYFWNEAGVWLRANVKIRTVDDVRAHERVMADEILNDYMYQLIDLKTKARVLVDAVEEHLRFMKSIGDGHVGCLEAALEKWRAE